MLLMLEIHIIPGHLTVLPPPILQLQQVQEMQDVVLLPLMVVLMHLQLTNAKTVVIPMMVVVYMNLVLIQELPIIWKYHLMEEHNIFQRRICIMFQEVLGVFHRVVPDHRLQLQEIQIVVSTQQQGVQIIQHLIIMLPLLKIVQMWWIILLVLHLQGLV